MQTLTGGRAVVGIVLDILANSVFLGLVLLFLLFLSRALLRRQWAAAALFIVIFIFAAAGAAQVETPLIVVPFRAVAALIWVLLLTRFGLLAVIACFFTLEVLNGFPVTTEASAWYAGIGLVGLLVFGAVAVYGFSTSLGGRRAFGGLTLEE
jgi:hypothetical protein